MKKTRIHSLIRSARKQVKALHKAGAFGALALVFALAFTVYVGSVEGMYPIQVVDEGGGGDYPSTPKTNLPSDNTTNTSLGSTVDVSANSTAGNGNVAGRQIWSTTISNTFWYAWNRGTIPSSDTSTRGWATALSNPNITIGYDYSVYDTSGNIIEPNSTVASGKTVILKFSKYVPDNIFWFGTGSSMDSPYGYWSANAAPPARVSNNVTCSTGDFVEQYVYDPSGSSLKFDVYIPFMVNPPSRSVTAPSGMSCGSIVTNSDGSVQSTCTITAASGTVTPKFNYAATTGKFYYRYKDYRDMSSIGWGGPGCYGNNIPLTASSITGWGTPSGPMSQNDTSIKTPYVVSVPAQSFSYPLNVGAASNGAPGTPSVSCTPSSATAGADVSVNLTATDPNGDTVSYSVDWNNDGTPDSGWSTYVSSGTGKTITKTGGWSAAGTYTVKGFAKDSNSNVSTPASCSFTVGAGATAPTAKLTASPTSVTSGNASTLTWSSTNATTCTGTGFNTRNATSGSVSSGAISGTTRFTVTCTGPGGSDSDSATVSVLSPGVDLTAGFVDFWEGSNRIKGSRTEVGTALTFKSTASNNGSTKSGSFPVLFQIQNSSGEDVDLIDSSYLAAIPGGSSAQASIPYTFSDGGTYTVRACANVNTNWDNIVTETNYGNNCSGWATINVDSAPDLPGGDGAFSCTVDDSAVPPGTVSTYTAVGGAPTDRYTWTPSDGGSSDGDTTYRRMFNTTGSYGMQVMDRTGANRTANCPVVTVGNACTTPTATITATPTRVRSGGTATLQWSASGVSSSCTITGPGVSKTVAAGACSVPQSSLQTPAITTQSVYTIKCDGTAATAQVIVNVIPQFDEF